MQVNYDFYEDLDPDKVDAIFEQLQEGKKPKPVPPSPPDRCTTACPPKCP